MKPFTVPVVQDYHLLWSTFPGRSYVSRLGPRSLGATCGVAVAFLSYSYLDVSVRCVRSTGLMHSDRSHHSVGLPHSEIRGSQPSYRLLSAYRRFSRPSSPLNAKASIMCPFSLGHAYLAPAGDRCMPCRTLRIRHPARVKLLTRTGDSILEIVLGSIQSCAPSRCSLEAEARCGTRVWCATTNTSLVKEPESLWANGDGQWY